MNDILQEIAANKHRELDALYQDVKFREFIKEKAKACNYIPQSISGNIRRSSDSNFAGIIAEFKRKSPSKGDIAPNSDVAKYIGFYDKGKASACSVLTDTRFFGGALTDLSVARSLTKTPLLRKDFIIDEIQISETRIFGADAILLIASILTMSEIKKFTDLAHSLDMEVLFEIHGDDEIEKIYPDVDMIGVNNRKLSSFNTDVNHSLGIIDKLPEGCVYVAESGITTPEDIKKLMGVGYQGFLVGESLMRSEHPATTLEEFRHAR